MSDFESSLQRWILIFLVFIVITVSAMNYWYKVLPEKREAAIAAATPMHASSPRPQSTLPTAVTAPVVPVAPVQPAPPPAAQPRDSGIPHVELPDGRTFGFDLVDARGGVTEGYVGPHVTPWIRDETGVKTLLPAPPSYRQKFIAVLLEDGRIALMGGMTPRDMVALDRQCEDCAEEYIAFGDPELSTSTDVYDVDSGAWSKGPTSAHPGDFAIRLRDGRIFKMGLSAETNDERYSTRITAETADAAFTKWDAVGETRIMEWYTHARVFEARSGVVMLLNGSVGQYALHWNGRGKLVRWLEDESWTHAKQLDEGHLQLTQSLDAYPPKTKELIVELP